MHSVPERTTPESGGIGESSKPPSLSSPTSIAPVGLELTLEANQLEQELDMHVGVQPAPMEQTGSIPIRIERRRLGGIVIAALAGCALILVAAVIARVGHASSEPQIASPPKDVAKEAPTPAPAVPITPTAAAVPEIPPTGTLRLERPALPGRVWLDGKKLTSPSVLIRCGTHQIKVGTRGRTRSVQVPCDGELVIDK
jgi:hypothetical protein